MNNYYCIKGTLIEKKKDAEYLSYIFKDDATHQYLMCTQLPNWQIDPIEIGEEGYILFKEVEAGITEWYDKVSGQRIRYNYDGIYLINFIRVSKHVNDIII